MTSLNAYLIFEGTAAQAMRLYERTLGGKLDIMTFADMPDADPACTPVDKNGTMHARLVFDGGEIMASDTMAGQVYEGMKGFALALTYADVPKARQVFDALAEGGSVTMPPSKTFWAESFGMCTDRFGTPWMVSGGPIEP